MECRLKRVYRFSQYLFVTIQPEGDFCRFIFCRTCTHFAYSSCTELHLCGTRNASKLISFSEMQAGTNSCIFLCFQMSGQTFVRDRSSIKRRNISNLTSLCRMCASRCEKPILIYSPEGVDNELALKIQNYLPIKVLKHYQTILVLSITLLSY